MLKKQVGPFEFQKITVQSGNGRVLPNDFSKCHVFLTLESYAGISNEDILSNSLSYSLDCNIDVTIGLGEKYFDCGVDLCLQTMVEGETARCKFIRNSLALKTKDSIERQKHEITKATDCTDNLKHSDCCASNKVIHESIGDARDNVEKVTVVPQEQKENCNTSSHNVEINSSTNNDIQTEACTEGIAKNCIKSFVVGGCDASNKTASTENATASTERCVASCLVINITLISSASEVLVPGAEEHLARASLLKDLGVNCFKRSDVPTAFYKFNRSLRYLLVCSFKETETDLFDAWNLLRCQCYLNVAACQLQRENFASAKLNCSRALELDTDNVKGLFRRAQASIKLDEYEDARNDLEHALTQEPSNTAVIKNLSAVQNVLKARDKKLGDAMSKLFK